MELNKPLMNEIEIEWRERILDEAEIDLIDRKRQKCCFNSISAFSS